MLLAVPIEILAHPARFDSGVLEDRHQALEMRHLGGEDFAREGGGYPLGYDIFRRRADDADETGHPILAGWSTRGHANDPSPGVHARTGKRTMRADSLRGKNVIVGRTVVSGLAGWSIRPWPGDFIAKLKRDR